MENIWPYLRNIGKAVDSYHFISFGHQQECLSCCFPGTLHLSRQKLQFGGLADVNKKCIFVYVRLFRD